MPFYPWSLRILGIWISLQCFYEVNIILQTFITVSIVLAVVLTLRERLFRVLGAADPSERERNIGRTDRSSRPRHRQSQYARPHPDQNGGPLSEECHWFRNKPEHKTSSTGLILPSGGSSWASPRWFVSTHNESICYERSDAAEQRWAGLGGPGRTGRTEHLTGLRNSSEGRDWGGLGGLGGPSIHANPNIIMKKA